MKEVQGDLIALAQAGEFEVIIHGCNCFCAMGAGIAAAIKKAFPAAYRADQTTAKGDRAKLGTCSTADCITPTGRVTVINAYTQHHWAGSGVLADYEAIRSCMQWVKQHYSGQRIGIPKIGAGLARGDWTTIQQIIEDELGDEDLTLVLFG